MQGDAWSQLLVQGAMEGAALLETFLLKWQYSVQVDAPHTHLHQTFPLIPALLHRFCRSTPGAP